MNNKSFNNICKKIRHRIITSLYLAGGGHAGPSLSIVEILSYLYFDRKILNPKRYEKFVLSKGHSAPALYATLNLIGKITDQELNSLRKIGTSALGQGLSIAIGFAIAEKIKRSKKNHFV